MQTNARFGCHQQIVTIDDIFFSYENKPVISGLNFSILERDFVGLVGSNGAGKTTLLKMIVGLLKPARGEIRLFGQPIEQFRDWERVGYVPQKNALNPLFPATVREVVTSGLFGKKNMFRRLSKQERSKADDALYAMRIEDLADRRIGQLSGGQQQRVFLARALINNPELLILDEPTVGIDAETQAGFFRMIRHMHQHHHITFIMVSHDMDMIQSYLGEDSVQKSGGLSFYVKHTHEPENCRETDLTHSMQQLRETIEV
ncbi:metal ABC transporter ATP-binding protein [Paenibacillus ehimensis]|uniref:Metal ABC transporter ATP-binding protein n=1 Tax=Paenibacillus ehimensis TaxID=79264 RepID=A0ABT8V648_9BACL|nr:metal ABC transporter ATP-binding protein [Paenibacillus ehimensis]MDO3676906.1 metal ABC transporter ATP-binding protein [Paenibacillus ehimensis]MEC0208707.1 metal ABC transporter ATP-binding protein [Paenibacillus ehimensis]